MPKKSVSKRDRYIAKFGKERVEQMEPYIKGVFRAEGIQSSMGGLVGNTLDSHRLMEMAFEKGGPALQDKLVNVLFRYYFEEEKDIADNTVLLAAAEEAGVEGGVALFKSDADVENVMCRMEEFPQVRGVPHFIIKTEGMTTVELSGAQEPDVFVNIFDQIQKK